MAMMITKKFSKLILLRIFGILNKATIFRNPAVQSSNFAYFKDFKLVNRIIFGIEEAGHLLYEMNKSQFEKSLTLEFPD